jgi:hypothetical protein
MKMCPYCEQVMLTLSIAPPTFQCTPCGLTYIIRYTVGNRTNAMPTFQRKPHRPEVPQAFKDAFEGKVLEP